MDLAPWSGWTAFGVGLFPNSDVLGVGVEWVVSGEVPAKTVGVSTSVYAGLLLPISNYFRRTRIPVNLTG